LLYLKLLVSLCRFVNLQIVRTKTFIRKRRRRLLTFITVNIVPPSQESRNIQKKQLKLQDKGDKPKRACPPTDEEINILYNRNVMGSHTPQSLLNTLIWLNNSVQFEHQTLRLLHIFYYKIRYFVVS
jgi:hypothetical protein